MVDDCEEAWTAWARLKTLRRIAENGVDFPEATAVEHGDGGRRQYDASLVLNISAKLSSIGAKL